MSLATRSPEAVAIMMSLHEYFPDVDGSYFAANQAELTHDRKQVMVMFFKLMVKAFQNPELDAYRKGAHRWAFYNHALEKHKYISMIISSEGPPKTFIEKPYLYERNKLDALLTDMGEARDIVIRLTNSWQMVADSDTGWRLFQAKRGAKQTIYERSFVIDGEPVSIGLERVNVEMAAIAYEKSSAAINDMFHHYRECMAILEDDGEGWDDII